MKKKVAFICVHNSCRSPKYEISPYAKLLLYMGMRCGELCALKWISYDREMKTLDISRTRYEAKNRDKNSTRKTKAGEGTSKNVKAISLINVYI